MTQARNGQNWGEPRKMTQKQQNFLGGPNGKVLALGLLVTYPVEKNRDSKTKNRPLSPNIQVFGSKLHILFLADNWSPSGQSFQHKKVPHWFPDMRVPKVLLQSPKKWNFGQKRPNLAKN